MGGQDQLVEVVGESTIYAEKPILHSAHTLSNLDLVYDNNRFYAQLVFLFRAGIKPEEIPETVESLKTSASKLLNFYPVLAGRLAKNKNDYNRTVVDVKNAGIPFYEARCQARLSDWDDLRHLDIDLALNPSNNGFDSMETAPLIRLQATFFQDGGVALGFSAMHMLVDGANCVDFMKSWGEIHRGVGQISKPPAFSTELIKSTLPPDATSEDIKHLKLPENMSFFEDNKDMEFNPSTTAKKKLKRHTFKLSEESVQKLMQEVESGPYKYGRVSSYEAVAALFWKYITMARGDDIYGTSHFTIPVSITRPGRFDPELPWAYFGNSAVMTLATTTAENIRSEHISYAAKLIHDKARSYVPQLAKAVIDLLEMRLRQGKNLGISIGEGPPSGRDVLSTSFTGFPVYEIEFKFAKLGQCIFSFPLDIAEGLIATLPAPEGGRGRHVAVCIREEHIQKLIADPFFSNYCIV